MALLNNLAICHLREEEPLAGGVPAATKLFAAAGDIAMTSKVKPTLFSIFFDTVYHVTEYFTNLNDIIN